MPRPEFGLHNYSFVLLNSLLVLILSVAVFAQGPAQRAGCRDEGAGFYDPLPQDTGEAGLKQELRKLQNTGRLMMVVAHPDDEDGGLLTLEARGKGVQTLLMTLTRGEGGQNKTGDTDFPMNSASCARLNCWRPIVTTELSSASAGSLISDIRRRRKRLSKLGRQRRPSRRYGARDSHSFGRTSWSRDFRGLIATAMGIIRLRRF